MSVIVGRATGQVVVLAADSITTDANDTAYSTGIPKAFVHKSGLVFGTVGRAALGDALRELTLPPRSSEESAEKYVRRQIVGALRSSSIAIRVNDRQKLPEGCALLVGIDGLLYAVFDDFGVTAPTPDGYFAIGAGAQVALGALYALRRRLVSAQHSLPRVGALLSTAVEAATAHRLGCATPVVIVTGGRAA
jgi:hypothetical protein